MSKVTFYKKTNSGGDHRDYTGCVSRYDMGNSNWYNDNDNETNNNMSGDSSSIKTYDNTWVRVYSETHYGGYTALIGPNTTKNLGDILDRTGHTDMGNKIKSFKLYDYDPAAIHSPQDFTASGSEKLKGYDMILSVTQQDINSQFETLKHSTIHTYVHSNCVSNNDLTSEIRGVINTPTVNLENPHNPNSNNQCQFQVTFSSKEIKDSNRINPAIERAKNVENVQEKFSSAKEKAKAFKDSNRINPTIEKIETSGKFKTIEKNKKVKKIFPLAKEKAKGLKDEHPTLEEIRANLVRIEGTNYGYIKKKEHIRYVDHQGDTQTLSNKQFVYYLIKSETVGSGALTQTTYSFAPSLFYYWNNKNHLIDLSDLQASVVVDLSQIPTTTAQLQDMVNAGLVSPSVMDSVNDNEFDSNVFSLTQLFLDFDNANFMDWGTGIDLDGPDGQNTEVGIIHLDQNSYSEETISQLMSAQGFTQALSENLEVCFGVNPSKNASDTPYIISVNATVNNTSGSADAPSFAPSYIVYGTDKNTDATPVPNLNTLNYLMMGGDDGPQRAPMNGSNPVYVTDNLVDDSDYAGKIYFDPTVMYYPYLLNPIKLALCPNIPVDRWTNSGVNRYEFSDYETGVLDVYHANTTLGTGQIVQVAHDSTRDYYVTSFPDPDNKIKVEGSIKLKLYASKRGKDGGVPSPTHSETWWSYTLSFTVEFEWVVKDNEEVVLKKPTVISASLKKSKGENAIAHIMDVLDDVWGDILKGLNVVTFHIFENPDEDVRESVQAQFNEVVTNMNKNLAQASINSFIPPTGDTFFLNTPILDDELNFVMNVDYSV